MGIFNKVKKGVVGAAVSAGSNVTNTAGIKKAEMELSNLMNKYDECYLIIGKRIAEFMRNGEDIDDAKVNEAFMRITKFDAQKSELETQIKEIKQGKEQLVEAQKLVAIEEEVDKEIAKCKELLDMGVDSQEDYDRKVASLRNKVKFAGQLNKLDQALSKKLITEDVYKQKRAAILGEEVVD